MKSYFLAFLLLILAVNTAKAIKCFQCQDSEGVAGGPSQKSCKSGKKPDKSLSVNCGTGYDDMVFAEGQVDGGFIKYAYRGCGIKGRIPDIETNQCKLKNSTELSDMDLVDIPIPVGVTGNVCLCDGDDCNSSSMLRVSQTLTVVAFGIFSAKFMDIY